METFLVIATLLNGAVVPQRAFLIDGGANCEAVAQHVMVRESWGEVFPGRDVVLLCVEVGQETRAGNARETPKAAGRKE